MLGVQHTVIEKVELEQQGEEEVLVATVRPTRSRQGRCGRCGIRAPRYDNGEGPRRWRSLDAGTTRVYLQAAAPRVSCPTHGVVVAAVPWARHGSRFTSAFEDTVAWLACHAALSVLAYSLCSGTMLLINKLAIYHIGCPAVVSAIQFVAATVWCLSLKSSGVLPVDDFEWSKVW